MKVSRRKFLKGALAAGATGAVGLLIGNELPLLSSTMGQTPSSGSQHHWVMVIDQDRCDGCKKCTEACITEHNVPSTFGGVPNYQGHQEWMMVTGEQLDDGTNIFQPTPCMHCQNAPCVKVCPVGANHYNSEGLVLIDHDRCIGCRLCMAACPYNRRFFNWGEPDHPANEAMAQYSEDFPVPHRKGTTEKCIFCSHRLKHGRLPACVEACATQGMKAIYFGDANQDVVTNSVEVVSLTELLKKGGYQLKPELGTRPSVYYLPRRH